MVARKPRPWLDTFRYCRVTEATQKHFSDFKVFFRLDERPSLGKYLKTFHSRNKQNSSKNFGPERKGSRRSVLIIAGYRTASVKIEWNKY